MRKAQWISLLAFTGAAVFAQFESATLTGGRHDSSGKVYPCRRESNQRSDICGNLVHTNGEGRYNFPSLRPGSYRVVAATAGFKQHVSSAWCCRSTRRRAWILSDHRNSNGGSPCYR